MKPKVSKRLKGFKVDLDNLLDYKFPPSITSANEFVREHHGESVNYYQVSISMDIPNSIEDPKLLEFLDIFF